MVMFISRSDKFLPFPIIFILMGVIEILSIIRFSKLIFPSSLLVSLTDLNLKVVCHLPFSIVIIFN